ncbi:MAG TPA: hypothetical protein VIS55_00745 [Pseudomonadales bacterium]
MMKRYQFGFILGLVVSLAPLAAEEDEPPKLRLGEAVQPKAYAIELNLVPESEYFSGIVTIQISVAAPPPWVIWLNARHRRRRRRRRRGGAAGCDRDHRRGRR